ncbi:MAG: heme o synthase [Candidatus Limnocylindrales bacterium]
MTRFQKLTLATAVATYLLVVWGAVVRVTESGLGCPDWPLCYGQLLPPVGDSAAWIEWFHRGLAAVVGLLVVAVLAVALRHHRQRAIVIPALLALVFTGFQAYLGKVTVETGNSGDSVTAHLAMAMIVLASLVYIALRVRYPARLPAGGGPQRFTLLAAFSALSVYALLLFGSHVTATDSALVFGNAWPLFPNGALWPTFDPDPAVAALQLAHLLHRLVSVVVGVIVLITAWVAWRRNRDGSWGPVEARPVLLALTGTAAALFAIQVVVGAAQILTTLAAWSVALHLALGAAIWALLVAAAVYAYCTARVARPTAPAGPEASPDAGPEATPGTGERGAPEVAAGDPAEATGPPGATAAMTATTVTTATTPRARIGAYVALTKPRIIELLLVTTLPAMVLAARGIPRLDLMVWTLLGGTLAAGAANAVNQVVDRDIDLIMTRTRRRPLPAQAIAPEDALVFGLALGVIAFAAMAFLVNLLAAFLTLLAMAFYVVVYSLLMKRSTPQNIVIGGLAGALPPLIGWVAVTGDVALPALVLVGIVFYWTPPHFWALSMRLARDYRAAGVPMLPVVRGVPETTKHIALYSCLMVALSLVLFTVGQLGLLYLVGAVVLGAAFLFQAMRLWIEGTDAGAVRLYRFSTTYLTALFALIVIDVLVPIAL